MTATMSERIDELTRARVPFVEAVVVRAQEPASAHAGDRAIVLADGSVEGFVGGQCAVGSVRHAALAALESGDSLLLRVLPGGAETFPDTPGATVVVNPCLSGGALEIYLQPSLPPPVLHVVGTSPTAEALAALAPQVGFVFTRPGARDVPSAAGADAVVVCTHGGDETVEVRRALDEGARFVGVVCSRTRGAALLAELDLPADARDRVHVHVGLDIGARTAPEIALSILAGLVRALRAGDLPGRPARTQLLVEPAETAVRTVVDPVCGMTVAVTADSPSWEVDGERTWFCCARCRATYAAAHPG